jgi:UDP-N-acetylmuramoylalanine--D-glutamate ligase
MNYANTKALVCGMARSGISAAGLLKRQGASVTLQDLKTEDKLNSEDIAQLKSNGVDLYLGKNPDDIIGDFDMLVLSPGIPTDLPFVNKARELGVEVLGEVELAYRLSKAPLIAITGTNGKTTTTTLVGEIMKAFNPDTYVVGNIGTPFSDYADKTTAASSVVAEMSSFQLETIKEFHPKVSAVLNITPDHLNRHHTLENYIAAKERVFENQTAEDFTILNYNDSATRDMANRTKAKVIYFSLDSKLEGGIYSDSTSIYIDCMGYSQKVIDIDELNILGGHNVENAMAAIGCGVCAGVPLDVITATLKVFKAVEHRIEYVDTVKDVAYYNDSKGTNPDASIKAVLAMKKPICLIAGGYDKGSDFTDWIQYFPGRVKYVAVLGAVKQQLKDTLDKAGFTDYELADTFEDAFNMCAEHAESGDCVLLSPACASWDMFDSYEQRGEIFKELVKNLNNK